VHDSNAIVWKDLVGDKDVNLLGGVWGENHLVCDGETVGAYGAELFPDSIVKTVEIGVYDIVHTNARKIFLSVCRRDDFANPLVGFSTTTRCSVSTSPSSTSEINNTVITSSTDITLSITYNDKYNPIIRIGNQVQSSVAYGWSLTTTNISFGGRFYNNASSFCANCKIRYARIYSRALTAEEIAHNYEIDRARFNLS
jgi:hypothetical protein